MKAVGYISSYKTQALERNQENIAQREIIEDFCRNSGFQLVRLYQESEESRADFKPQLVKLINEATEKEFNAVIAFNTNILGTDEELISWIKQELNNNGVNLYFITEPEKRDLEKEKKDKADRIKEKVRDIPSLPEVVTRVVELVQDPDSSAAQLSKIISYDAGLTSRVLRLVNSAYYGFPKQISSIQHAIMILGFTTIRGLVLSSSIFKIFAPKNNHITLLDYKKFWRHCIATAISAKLISKYLYFQAQEDIFSSAILHDIGKIILDQYDHDNFIQVLAEAQGPLKSDLVRESEIKNCGITHDEMGYIIVENWNLPQSLSEVIKYHHTPLESQDHKMLTGIVYLGNIFSHIILDKLDLHIELFDKEVLDYLGLSEGNLEEINLNITQEIQNIGDLDLFFK